MTLLPADQHPLRPTPTPLGLLFTTLTSLKILDQCNCPSISPSYIRTAEGDVNSHRDKGNPWPNRPPSPMSVPLAGMLQPKNLASPSALSPACLPHLLSPLSHPIQTNPILCSDPAAFPFKAKFLQMMASCPHLLIHTVANLVSTSASHLPKVTNALLKPTGGSGRNPHLWPPCSLQCGDMGDCSLLACLLAPLCKLPPPWFPPQGFFSPIFCICTGKVTLTCGPCTGSSARDQSSKLSQELPPSDRWAASTPYHSQWQEWPLKSKFGQEPLLPPPPFLNQFMTQTCNALS